MLRSLRKYAHRLCVALVTVPTLAGALEIGLVSDLNGRYGSAEYNQRVTGAIGLLAESPPGLVISTGDMVAGQSRNLTNEQFSAMWRAFHEAVSGPLRQAGIPFAITPGNHDGSALAGFEKERALFAEQWSPRAAEFPLVPGSEWPRRYGFILDDVLLIGFDGTRPGPLPEQELAFLRNLLENHRNKARAAMVFSHLPMWPFAIGREREIIADEALLSLLHRYQVNVYASGHHHVFWSGTDASGMLHVAVGSLGGSTRRFPGESTRQPFSFARLNFDETEVRVEAFAAPDFEPLSSSNLPPHIDGRLGRLQRSTRSPLHRANASPNP